MSVQKSVFISYAHKDGLDFTRRLSYALSMYMDVFWDRRLPAVDFPSQIEEEIENRDFLLLVMTPFSIASEWCQRELQHAEKHKKGIVLARVIGIKLGKKGKIRENSCTTNNQSEDALDDFYQHK